MFFPPSGAKKGDQHMDYYQKKLDLYLFYLLVTGDFQLCVVTKMAWLMEKKQEVCDNLVVCVLNLEFVQDKIKIKRKNFS